MGGDEVNEPAYPTNRIQSLEKEVRELELEMQHSAGRNVELLAEHLDTKTALDDARAALVRIETRCNTYAALDKAGLLLSIKQDSTNTLASIDARLKGATDDQTR